MYLVITDYSVIQNLSLYTIIVTITYTQQWILYLLLIILIQFLLNVIVLCPPYLNKLFKLNLLFLCIICFLYKRKVDNENRKFQTEWPKRYFFTLSVRAGAIQIQSLLSDVATWKDIMTQCNYVLIIIFSW